MHAPQFLYQDTGLYLPLMKLLNEYEFKAEEKLDAVSERVYCRLARHLIQGGTRAFSLFGTIKEETKSVVSFHSEDVLGFMGSELDRPL